jgi:energy-coupling factor transport system permease protein
VSGRAAVAQYFPAGTWLHRLDPRAKIVVTVALAVALFTRESLVALSVYAALAAAGVAMSRVPLSWFWRGLKPVVWLLALTVIAQLLFSRGEALADWGPFTVTSEGLMTAALLCLRLVLLVTIGLLLTFTTAPIPLTDGLAWLLRPLRAVRLPTEELALMVTIALRFIPTLLGEVETIMRAQRARGADFSHGGPIKRARALVPVLVPLFVLSFRRADQLALAMEARCYEPGQRRTRLHPLRAGWADLILVLLAAGAIALASFL